jgi:Rad3-related DNA helicase
MYDGKKPARNHQLEIDAEVSRLFAEGYEVIGLNLPPGYGKSYMARGWQRKWPRTDIVTANNNLIRQYQKDYPELNAVMGKDNYDTSETYETAKRNARRQAQSIFNPLSAIFTCPRSERSVEYIVVDEAHTLGEMLRSSATCTLNTSSSGLPKGITSEYQLVRWIKQRFYELREAATTRPTKQIVRQYEQIGVLYYAAVGQEQNSVFSLTRVRKSIKGRQLEQLHIDVVDYPMGIVETLFGSAKVILMSGTLTKYETEKLANGRKWAWVTRPYLAPPENRPVYVRGLDREDRKDIPKVCSEIRRIYMESGEQPMLVHVTYGDMNEYKECLSGLRVLSNSPRNKATIEARFRKSGGIWLAAGCSEGIDLPDDACRTIIIPRLQFPNKGDMYVQKRLGRPDGRKWYALKTLETTIQQLGRGNRHSKDHCTGYVFDPYFAALWGEYKDEFEALNIRWEHK